MTIAPIRRLATPTSSEPETKLTVPTSPLRVLEIVTSGPGTNGGLIEMASQLSKVNVRAVIY